MEPKETPCVQTRRVRSVTWSMTFLARAHESGAFRLVRLPGAFSLSLARSLSSLATKREQFVSRCETMRLVDARTTKSIRCHNDQAAFYPRFLSLCDRNQPEFVSFSWCSKRCKTG